MAKKVSTISEFIEIGNLRRAWRWLKSNPDMNYKGYFRDSYGNYSLIEEFMFKEIQESVIKKTYEPSHPCKVFIPKASGILRPITLLKIEDQVVYQGMVNIIAEKLFPYMKNSYNTSTHGHLYAGKTSIWFYRKWSDGYKTFNQVARDSFNNGLKYTASFDLTACYDSLDHNVLRHFLKQIGCDDEFIDLLLKCLSKWTGTEKTGIYHNHGIPQGPLSSGLLSEVVLKYFDLKYSKYQKIKYGRYVDDIRLFAESEKKLRQALIRLDRISKEIGLFPQSSKIEIHQITDIEQELKSISNPNEADIQSKLVNQSATRKLLTDLTPRYKVLDSTKFKYLLAHITPSSKMTGRIWNIYKKNASYFPSLARYLKRYEYLPDDMVTKLFKELRDEPVYAATTSEIIDILRNRLKPSRLDEFHKIVIKIFKAKGRLTGEILLHASLVRVLVENNLLSQKELEYVFTKTEWQVKKEAIKSGEKSTSSVMPMLLNTCLNDQCSDVSTSAAIIIIKKHIPISGTTPSKIERVAFQLLKETGRIAASTPSTPSCYINIYFKKWLDPKTPTIDWKNIFSSKYSDAETFALNCYLKAGTDATSWVNAMDVFNDALLDELFKHDPTIGKYGLGNMGSVLNKGSAFSKKYPAIYAMVSSIHDKRLESNLSHAYTKSTKKLTGYIKHNYYSRIARPLITKAFQEIARKW